eukprot:gene592-1253_t
MSAALARFALSKLLTRSAANTQTCLSKGGINNLVKQLSHKQNIKYFRTTVLAAKSVEITFVDRDGDRTPVKAKIGETLLDVAKDNDIDLEGACEGTLACSTCHLIFDQKQYEELGLEPPSEEELDMLDLAYGLTDTSRLGCQIEVTEEMDGLVLTVPSGTSDARNF